MASFQVECPSCEAKVPVRDAGMVGRKIDCPKCKFRFVVNEQEEPEDLEEASEDAAPAKKSNKSAAKGKSTAVTDKPKTSKGQAKNPDLDEGDTPDVKKNVKKAPSMLVIGGGLGLAALTALGIGGYFIFGGGGDSSKKEVAKGNPPPVTAPANAPQTKPGTPTPKPGNNPEIPKELPKDNNPALSQTDITNFLPNDTRAVINLSLDNLRTSSINSAMLKTPGGFNAKSFLKTFGFPLEEVSRVVMGFNDQDRWTFCVVRTSKVINEAELVSHLKATAEEPIKQQPFYTVKRELDPLGNFLLKNPEGNYFLRGESKAAPLAMRILDTNTLVFGDVDPMKKFLEDGGKPKVLFQPPTPVVPVQPGVTPGQTPRGPGGPNQPPGPISGPGINPGGGRPGPGGPQPPQGAGAPAGQPGGPVGNNQYPPGMGGPGNPAGGPGGPPGGAPGAPNRPGRGGPAAGGPGATPTPVVTPAPVVAGSWITIKPELKSVLDKSDKGPKPAIISFAGDMRFLLGLLPRLREQISANKLDNPLINQALADVGKILPSAPDLFKTAAVSVSNFREDRLAMMAALEANSDSGLSQMRDWYTYLNMSENAGATSGTPGRPGQIPGMGRPGGNQFPPGMVGPGAGPGGNNQYPPGMGGPGNGPGGPGAGPGAGNNQYPPGMGGPGNGPGGPGAGPGGNNQYPPGMGGPGNGPGGPGTGPGAGNNQYPPGMGGPGNGPGGPGAGPGAGNNQYPPGMGGPGNGPGGPGAGPGGNNQYPPGMGGPGNGPGGPGAGPGGNNQFPPGMGGPGRGPGRGPGLNPGGTTGNQTPPAKPRAGDWTIDWSDRTLVVSLNRTIKPDDYKSAMSSLSRVMIVLRGESEMVNNRSRVHELAAALMDYVKAKGQFPQGTWTKAESADSLLPFPPEKRLSWMVELLPYLQGGEFKELGFDATKAWSETPNSELARLVIPQYVVRGGRPELPYRIEYPGNKDKFAATHFVGVAGVGMDAAYYTTTDAANKKRLGVFGYDRTTKPEDIKDGADKTIALIMVPVDHKSPWVAGGGSTVRGVAEDPDCFKRAFVCAERDGKKGTYVIMADGKVRFIAETIPPETFRALCTIDGGEKIEKLDGIAPEVVGEVTETELKTVKLPPDVKEDPKAEVTPKKDADTTKVEASPKKEPDGPKTGGDSNKAGNPAKADPREDLKTLIPELIRLYETMDYSNLAKMEIQPDQLKQHLMVFGSVEKVGDVIYGKNESAVTFQLKALKLIASKTPELSDDGKTATYKNLGSPYETIIYTKIGKYWYSK